MIESSPLRDKIAQGRTVIGTWFTMGAPLAAEALARSGLDFLVIDFEHGPFQLDRVHDYVHRCERYGCAPIVRVPANEPWMVLQALDQGAHGVIVPHAASGADARRLVDAVKYAPQGKRGFTPFTKAGGFTNDRGIAYAAQANSLTLAAVLVESLEGLERLDEILAEPGIDIVYFGAFDLSQALGEPGNVRHPKVIQALADAAARTRAAGKCPGGFVAQSTEDLDWLTGMGMRFITFGVDSAMMMRSYAPAVQWLKEKEG